MTQNTISKNTEHKVEINNRKCISMTGVVDVGNFSETAVDITTTNGTIILKGKGLNISKLDTDLGELNICGEIISIQYTKTKQKQSVFEGLFK